jgi:hypothetical protein
MVNLDMVGYPLSVNACGAAALVPCLAVRLGLCGEQLQRRQGPR